MDDWFLLSIGALFCMGFQRFLYKVSAERGCNTAWTTFYFMATVAVLSTIFFFISEEKVEDVQYLLMISALNSASFLVGTVAHIEALKHIPASFAYPIIRLNAVIVIVFSIIFFRDSLSLFQVAGIITAMAVIFILARDIYDRQGHGGNVRRGIALVAVAVLAGSVASISSKLAAVNTGKLGFMTVSYVAGSLFSLGLTKMMERDEEDSGHVNALGIGLVMGIVNFAGFYLFLSALSSGPLSIIVSIAGMHFVIAVILAALIYREKMSPTRITGTLLAIVSIILLRL